jgi:hypothetical protein
MRLARGLPSDRSRAIGILRRARLTDGQRQCGRNPTVVAIARLPRMFRVNHCVDGCPANSRHDLRHLHGELKTFHFGCFRLVTFFYLQPPPPF